MEQCLPYLNKLDNMDMAYRGMNMVPKNHPTSRDDPTDYHPTSQDGAIDHHTIQDRNLPSRIPAVLANTGMLILGLEPR